MCLAKFLVSLRKRDAMSAFHEQLEQERIWIEASRDDIAFFMPLYDKYYDPLFRFFMRRTDSLPQAEDLCSQTFCKAIDHLDSFEWKGKPFGAWLFTIAQNEIRKHYRDAKPIFVIEEDKLDCVEYMEDVSSEDYMPSLIALLDELPEKDLHLLELKYFEQCSFEEISQYLGVGVSAVKMRLYRMLERLRGLLVKEHDEA